MAFNIMSLLTDAASKVVDSVGNAFEKNITDKGEREQLKIDLVKEVNRHMEAVNAEANKVWEAELKDLDSARQMQTAALAQNDNFSKRFVYYLASLLILSALAFNFCFFFIEYPQENKDFLNRVEGVINTIGFASVISFFFGSTKGSNDKTKAMVDMAKKE